MPTDATRGTLPGLSGRARQRAEEVGGGACRRDDAASAHRMQHGHPNLQRRPGLERRLHGKDHPAQSAVRYTG